MTAHPTARVPLVSGVGHPGMSASVADVLIDRMETGAREVANQMSTEREPTMSSRRLPRRLFYQLLADPVTNNHVAHSVVHDDRADMNSHSPRLRQ